MNLTPREKVAVQQAVEAYLEMKKGHKGQFPGATADDVLEGLDPTPERWARLAALVIETAEAARKPPKGSGK